jgi:hypothetical protein
MWFRTWRVPAWGNFKSRLFQIRKKEISYKINFSNFDRFMKFVRAEVFTSIIF